MSEAALRDGSRVEVRPVRRSDAELLLRGFERLSDESRYRRFLCSMPELSEEMVRYLTDVDHHDHEAVVALDAATGEGVGVARYVRDLDRPERAEAAVTVIDDWQGRGLGTLLLELLAVRAREEGVEPLHRTDARFKRRDDGAAREPRAGARDRPRGGNRGG